MDYPGGMSLSPKQFSPASMPKRRPTPAKRDGIILSSHAAKQSTDKGWSHEDVLRAANDPQTTYDNGRYPGQRRHIRGSIVAVVDTQKQHVVTVYENVKETELRPDQKDKDAKRYAKGRG